MSSYIVSATLVEDALHDRILKQMRRLSKTEYNSLFVGDSPLASFSAKIRLASAFKLIDKFQTNEMNLIRELRNVFAHSRFHVDFQTSEIVQETVNIKTIDRVRNPIFAGIYKNSNYALNQIANSVRLHSPRQRYVGSCLYLAFALWDLPHDPDDWGEDHDNEG